MQTVCTTGARGLVVTQGLKPPEAVGFLKTRYVVDYGDSGAKPPKDQAFCKNLVAHPFYINKDAATVYTNTRSCTPGFLHRNGWRKSSASSEFMNFENRTLIKRDMAKNVSEDKI